MQGQMGRERGPEKINSHIQIHGTLHTNQFECLILPTVIIATALVHYCLSCSDPPFVPKPSLQLVADYLVKECTRRYPLEKCPFCSERALPEDPKVGTEAVALKYSVDCSPLVVDWRIVVNTPTILHVVNPLGLTCASFLSYIQTFTVVILLIAVDTRLCVEAS